MTIIAIVVLAIWALGIVGIAVGSVLYGREHPLVDAAMFANPVRFCLALAVIIVFWPAAIAATGLQRLLERGRR